MMAIVKKTYGMLAAAALALALGGLTFGTNAGVDWAGTTSSGVDWAKSMSSGVDWAAPAADDRSTLG